MRVIALLFLIALVAGNPVFAQDDLSLTNNDTRVSRISFRFPESRTFEDERLAEQIATSSPGFIDRLRKRFAFLPFVSAPIYPFDPVQLQQDVVRLRRFFARNGFPEATVDYPASQFDQSDNEIHVIFTIREGPPLLLSGIDLNVEGALSPEMQEEWPQLEEDLQGRIDTRYTDFERLSIESRILSQLQDNGYAFASVETSSRLDESRLQIDLQISVSTGPYGHVSEIQIEGNESIERNTVLRELPFEVGDEYSRSALNRGQREIFGLSLFRLALVDLPEQDHDSTVVVRYRVREVKPRYLSLQGGFSRETGLTVESLVRHRNFFGGARQFSISAGAQPGILAKPATGRKPIRSLSTGISFRQPYLFATSLSSTISPFYNWLDNPNQDTRFYEFGVNTGVLAELLPFRTISTQYTFGRAVPLTESGLGDRFDVYDRSILSVGATLGRLDDFLIPREGWLVRPFIESGGLVGASGVQYFKARLGLAGVLPITSGTSVSLTLNGGKFWPVGNSRDQTDPQTEFRFDAIRLYAGGATDVRGWGLNLLGPQVAVVDTIVVDEDGSPTTQNARFEAVGGEAKLVGQLELHMRAPWLGDAWRIGTFLDFGAVSSRLLTDENGRVVKGESGIAQFEDEGMIRLSDLRFGTGVGLRYETPVGMIRLDLAYKLNPSGTDLQAANERALFEEGFTDTRPDERFRRRFNFHLSIGRTF